jgi:hypothetical protein
MFSSFRWLSAIAVVLVLVGVWRGWVAFSQPAPEPDSKKIDIRVTVDTQKVKSDVDKVKQEVNQRMAQRNEGADPGAPAPTVK